MFKYVTNIVLAVLLLSSTAGFFISGHHCDFSFGETAINAEANSCCMEMSSGKNQPPLSSNIHVHGFHQHGLADCRAHEDQGCSCHSDHKYFTMSETLVINRPFSFSFSGAGAVTAYNEHITGGWNRFLSGHAPPQFSFLKLPVNIQAVYGVFTC